MKEKSLKKNFAYNFLYQLLAIVVPLITSPYLARTLGAESIGIASWTNSIVFYFGMFIVLGVENYGNRFYTTSAGLIAGDCIPGAITCEEVIAACRKAASS